MRKDYERAEAKAAQDDARKQRGGGGGGGGYGGGGGGGKGGGKGGGGGSRFGGGSQDARGGRNDGGWGGGGGGQRGGTGGGKGGPPQRQQQQQQQQQPVRLAQRGQQVGGGKGGGTQQQQQQQQQQQNRGQQMGRGAGSAPRGGGGKGGGGGGGGKGGGGGGGGGEAPRSGAPSMSKDEIKKRVKGMLKEWCGIKDLGEAELTAKELVAAGGPGAAETLVCECLDMALNGRDAEREAMAELLSSKALLGGAHMPAAPCIKGMMDVLCFLGDLVIDVPKAFEYCAALLGPVFAAQQLHPQLHAAMADKGAEWHADFVESGAAPKLFVAIAAWIKANHDEAKVKELGAAGFKIAPLCAAGANGAEMLDGAGLGGLGL